KRPVAVHKGVHREPFIAFLRQASMIFGESVAEFFERLPQMIRRVGVIDSVMKMNLDLTQTFGLHLRKAIQHSAVILLGGIKVCVPERNSVVVVDGRRRPARLFVPRVEPSELRADVEPGLRAVPTRFEVICDYEDEMTGAILFSQAPHDLLCAPE